MTRFLGWRGSWSLAAQLTAWYTITSFAVVLAASSFLYFVLVRSLDREDDQFLNEEVRVLSNLLRTWPNSRQELEQEISAQWANREHAHVYGYITDLSGNTIATSTRIDAALLEMLSEAARAGSGRRDLQTQSGKHLRSLTQIIEVADVPGTQFRIAIAFDRSRKVNLVASYRRRLLMALTMAMALCAAVGYRLARKVASPLRLMGETASHISSSKLNERIATEGLPSELLLLAQNFNEMLKRLQHSFSRLSRFSANIAHELRTPINNLRGEIDVALSQDRDPADYRLLLESLQEECIRLTSIVEGLLFLARADHLQVGTVVEEFDLSEEILKIADLYDPLAKSRGVGLHTICTARSPFVADRGLVQRALANLVDNAIFHTPAGGHVAIRASDDYNFCLIAVADTGSGIPQESLPYVFEPFFRLQTENIGGKQSLGLGLSLVKSITELHGGSVRIDSELHRGTTVTLCLPRRTPEPSDHDLASLHAPSSELRSP